MNSNFFIILGSILGSLSFIFGAAEFLYNIFKRAKVNLIITNDIFFRLIFEGESLFANIIVVGENKLVRITDLKLKLENQNDSRKITYKIRHVGKSRETNSPFQDFSFYSTSISDFISPNESKTIVLHAIEEDKSTEINKAFNEFNSGVIALSKDFPKINLMSNEKQKNEKLGELLQKLQELREKCLTSIIQMIKINDGDYNLSVELTYKPLSGSGFWIFKRLIQNKEYKVSEVKKIKLDNSAEKIKNDLNTLLWDNASNLLGFPNKTLYWPVIVPSEIND